MTSSSHEQAIEPGEPGYLMDIPSSTFLDGMKILDALANEDAVNLFFYTEKGNVSSKEAMEALGLSQKRFYTRLKLLLDADLLEKREEGYQHTFLGTLVHKLGLSLLNIVEKKEQIDILDKIRKSSGVSPEKTSQIAKALSIEIPFLDETGGVKIIDSWEELVSATVDMIGNAENEILMATQYIHPKAVDAGYKQIEKGATFKGIISQAGQFSQVLKIVFSLLSSPKQLSSFYKFLKSPNFNVRFTKIPYTFLVTDKKNSIIEIKNPITDDFQFAFVIKSEKFSEKMVDVFESIWEKASDIKDKLKI